MNEVTLQRKIAYGNNLRAIIAKSGLSQKAWAAKHNMPRQTVGNIIRGRNLPSPQVAERLADITGYERLVTDALIKVNCTRCGTEMYRDSRGLNRTQVLCAQGCRSGRAREVRADSRQRFSGMEQKRLKLFEERVAAHCNTCGGQTCPDANCELRRISPLPLRGPYDAVQNRLNQSLIARRASRSADHYRGVTFVQRIPGTEPVTTTNG